jgi:predicted DNA-binding protein YlxM (UPF0122 family)
MNVRLKALNEQEELVMRLYRDEKLSHVEIAKRLGVTKQRVREVHAQALERLEDFARHGEESLLLLPMRARKFLQKYPLGERATIRTAIETGGLWWDDRRGRICQEHEILWGGASWATWAVLHEWARLPAPIPTKPKKCPHCGGVIGV